MRLRHKKNAEAEVFTSPLVITNPCCRGRHPVVPVGATSTNPNDVRASFTSPTHPLHIELGMGKGKFIIEMSKQNSDINYIGIERSATIVLKAITAYEVSMRSYNSRLQCRGEHCEPATLPHNLRFMCENVENLENIFSPHSIDKIYLNFSDPWPKKRHESRRLTHQRFLSIYEKLLKPGSLLEFKTDNVGLFDFSLEEIKNSNFKLLEYTYDLHNNKEMSKGNIMTEYEAKFSKLGNKICKLIAQI